MFAFRALLVISICSPPLVSLVNQLLDWEVVLEIPRSIMLEVEDGAIKSPRLTNPVSGNLKTIRGILVGSISEKASGGTRFGHVDSVTVNLSVSETIASKEIRLRCI